MIIEIFGPPAAGKTTLSRALADRLRQRGFGVDLALSYRPSEVAGSRTADSPGPLAFVSATRRLGRPAFETLATAGNLFGSSREARMAKTLLALMPPASALWSIRLRQYICRLTHAWNGARASGRIVIFDQAFVQVACSLELLGIPEHTGRLPLVLDLIPRADFLVRLEAPEDVLSARLMERGRRQGVLERMLELDLSTNLRSIEIIDRLEHLLHGRGAQIFCVDAADEASRESALVQLARTAAEQFESMAVDA